MAHTTLRTLGQMKADGRKFAVLTAYDATLAHWVSAAGTEVILVGDSLGMVIQGQASTVPVTTADMAYHTRAVARASGDSLIMVDMPFLEASTTERSISSAQALMQAGAHLVKVEGGAWLAPQVETLTRNGVPVCAHLGLTPQSVNQLGGYRVQGKEPAAAEALVADACTLCDAGASLVLVECIPAALGKWLAASVPAPVIGIGAGPDVDGQVLVVYDMLGLNPGRNARFVRNFMAETGTPQEAFQAFGSAVREGSFPGPEHSF